MSKFYNSYCFYNNMFNIQLKQALNENNNILLKHSKYG